MLLPFVFRAGSRPDSNTFSRAAPSSYSETQPASVASLWTVAVSVTTFCVSKAETGMVEFFVSSQLDMKNQSRKLTTSSQH